VLASIELSRVSHRASTIGALAQWQASAGTFLPLRSLTTLLFPDFFGNPRVVGDNNASGNVFAEWALYTGVCPLLLAMGALFLRPKAHGFYAILALLTLLVAMGPGSLPLYLFIPGFASTANPGRVLVLFSFAISCLAAFGLQGLMDTNITLRKRYQSMGFATVIIAILTSIGLIFVKAFLGDNFTTLLNISQFGMMVAGVWFIIALLLCFALPKTPKLAPALLILTILDLLFWGWGHNPTSPIAKVYPTTPGIEWLQQNAKDALIAPINPSWSMEKEGPSHAILPPNGLTVYGLHDIAGYDSLLVKTSKDHLDALTPSELEGRSSPPQNGNMAFIKTPEIAIQAGARYILLPSDAPAPSGLTEVYKRDDMAIYENPDGKNFSTGQTYDNTTLRVGFVLFLSAIGGLVGYIIYKFRPLRPFRAGPLRPQ
jgi:hypothetical protein